MPLTADTLPTAAELTADPRLAIQLALSIPDAGIARDFLRDWQDGKDLEAYWLPALREDFAMDEAA